MKTLKVVNGDFVFDETGQLALVSDDEEIAQAVEMCLSIEKGEFILDEFIGIDTTFREDKTADDEDVIDAILEAVEPLTEEEKIEGIENIETEMNERTCTVTSCEIVKIDSEDTIEMKGVDLVSLYMSEWIEIFRDLLLKHA